MKRWSPGQEVVLGPQVDDNLRSAGMYHRPLRLKPGMSGTVAEVVFENKRKHKQWVLVDVRSRNGNALGRVKLPSCWLIRPEAT